MQCGKTLEHLRPRIQCLIPLICTTLPMSTKEYAAQIGKLAKTLEGNRLPRHGPTGKRSIAPNVKPVDEI
eukprot:2596990-Amphidinium_carterae.1